MRLHQGHKCHIEHMVNSHNMSLYMVVHSNTIYKRTLYLARFTDKLDNEVPFIMHSLGGKILLCSFIAAQIAQVV